MKQSGIIIRTVAAMAVIFASGVWVGHTFCPRESAPEIIVSQEPSSRPQLPPKAGKMTARIAQHYRRELSLNDEQFQQFMPLLLEQQKKVADLPKRSAQRAESVRKFHEKIRKIIRPDQEPGLEKIMKEVEGQVVD